MAFNAAFNHRGRGGHRGGAPRNPNYQGEHYRADFVHPNAAKHANTQNPNHNPNHYTSSYKQSYAAPAQRNDYKHF